MRNTDVAIVGGGLAGSLAAAMLGKAGIDATLIDPHPQYPPDFRCEKLDGAQVELLKKTGLADGILRAATHDRECWIARFGYLVDKRPGDQYGIYYTPLVNTVRGLIPQEVPVIHAKATAIDTGGDRQTVTLSNGESVSARLVVLANGLNMGLRDRLGLRRKILSECHSVTIGFDTKPVGRPGFAFSALTYYAERTSDRAALITLFPIGATMRANLFVYRDMRDPWLKQFRDAPQETLFAMMPGLRRLMGDFEVTDFVRIRPVDLYATRGYEQAGLVLVGDAFSTSCPAAGTGARKAINDVERLCNVHIPRWLTTPGMDADKIAAFYDDPVKRECDEFSLAKAYSLRAFSLDTGLYWRLRRWGRFLAHSCYGSLRGLRHWLAARPKGESVLPAPTGAET
jgi:2-polyprenyl-6-methoxyphenol hydroxylase-like FAD-dependent oxidoreductase